MTNTNTNAEPETATVKPESPFFENREERENYYRWVYCVKHGITDMESYGVKPLGPVQSPSGPKTPARKSNKTIDLDLTPGMVTALRCANGAFSIAGTGLRWMWNLFALFTAVSIAAMIIGIMTA